MTLILPMLSLPPTAALVPSYGMKLDLATVTLDNFTEVLARQDVTIRAFTNSLLYAGRRAHACWRSCPCRSPTASCA